MKSRKAVVIGVIVVGVVLQADYARAQGSLTPPSAPTPTMKTLDQVEPRIAISTSGYTISQSGSYYLTTNIVTSSSTAGITISTNDVTLDLNGYSILGGDGNGIGIKFSPGMDNVLIQNGVVRDCMYTGIFVLNPTSITHCIFRHLRILNNGRASSSYDGLQAGSQALVEHCQIADNGGDGVVVGADSKVVDNDLIDNGHIGLNVLGTGTYVTHNIVKGNVDNYDLAAGNQLNLLLCEVPETLDWPCSVKFAGTLICTDIITDGITVNADDVTIDMDGHTLIGPGANSQSGIYQEIALRNLRIYNGKVVQWRGVARGGVMACGKNNQLDRIQAATNYYGIYGGHDNTISGCSASYNTDDGIHGGGGNTISGCSASYNMDDGIRGGYGNTISGCLASHNTNDGIYGADGSTISDCVAYYNMDDGIFGSFGSKISDCAAYYNTDDGIYSSSGSTISGCSAYHNTSDGIRGGDGSTISECSAYYNTGDGIKSGSGSIISGCSASKNTEGDGIEVSSGAQVRGNTCDNNGSSGDGAGIHVTGANNRIVANHVTNNDRGIDVDWDSNFIVRNSASGNGTNWTVAAGNVCLVVTATTGGFFSGDSGGSAPGSTDPNANFTF